MIEGIQAAVTIPVMAKCRIGHFAEAQVLQSLGVDYIDESEVLTPADEAHHVDKWAFTVPFVCGATNLGEALRRIGEGACMIRSKGEAGTGNIVEAVRHLRVDPRRHPPLDRRRSRGALRRGPRSCGPRSISSRRWRRAGSCPSRCSARVASPRRPTRRWSCSWAPQAVFVGSGIFKSEQPEVMAKAIVEATTHYADAQIVAKVSRGLGSAMPGAEIATLDTKLADRGW